MKQTKTKLYESIQDYVKSVKILLFTVIVFHLSVLTYFYPMVTISLIFVPASFYILYKWIELTYRIEQSNRNNLIALINATEYEPTRKLLLQELWYADLHSLGGEPVYKDSLTY